MVIVLLACLQLSDQDVDEPAPVQPSSAQAPPPAASTPEVASPGGTIGGEPILARPVVLGGISTADVEGVVGDLDWMGCHQGGTGKVLVQFTLSAHGAVVKSETASTSLRSPPAETCLNELLLATRFPELERGDKAVVKYTFAY